MAVQGNDFRNFTDWELSAQSWVLRFLTLLHARQPLGIESGSIYFQLLRGG